MRTMRQMPHGLPFRRGPERIAEMRWETDEERSCLPVELTINGRAVVARPGQTILELVREQHLDTIPTLCHEPGLPPFGSCFLCVIEVKDARGLLPSCTSLSIHPADLHVDIGCKHVWLIDQCL